MSENIPKGPNECGACRNSGGGVPTKTVGWHPHNRAVHQSHSAKYQFGYIIPNVCRTLV